MTTPTPQPAAPHEQASSLNGDNAFLTRREKLTLWVAKHKKAALSAGIAAAVMIGGGTVGGVHMYQAAHQAQKDVVPKRQWETDSQQTLPEAKVIKGHGKGTITTVDHEQGGKEVSAPLVGIDGIGGESGATLVPPENISQVGYYIRSAPFGVDGKGTSVVTSHINYNGVTGYGAVFTSLKKGDPITVVDSDGNETHYIVDQDPVNINKSSADYVQQTVNTINRMNGDNQLVMVTCGGQFLGADSPLGYADNIIVTASKVENNTKKVENFNKG